MHLFFLCKKDHLSRAQALLLVALALLMPALAAGQTVVSLTFDDGDDDQFQVLDVLTAHGMHATFFLNSGRLGKIGHLSNNQALLLAQGGNEIGGHTVDHVDLPTLDDAEKMRQICDDRVALTNLGFSLRSFAYPYADTNAVTEQIVAQCGYNSARGVGGIVSPESCFGCPFAETIPPLDLYHTKTPNSVKDWMTLDNLENYVLQAEQNGGGWVQIVFHHICDACQVNAVSLATFTAFLDWLQPRNASGTVVKTVGEVIGGPVQPLVNGPPPTPHPSNGNVLFNPSLELDANPADGIPDCWQLSGFGTNTFVFTRTNDAEDGSWAEQVDITSFSSGGRRILSRQDLGSCAPTAYPGHSYYVTGWYKTTTPPRFDAYYRTATGGWVWWAQSLLLPTSATWTQGIWIVPALPDGATAISVGLTIYDVGSMTVDNFTLTDADTAPPTVTITLPIDASIVGGTVTLSADADDAGGIDHVEFLVDGVIVGSVSRAPYVVSWDSTTVTGPNVSITARAFDLAGNQASSSIEVTVTNPLPPDTTPPVTTILCNGTTCGGGYHKSVTVTLSAIDLQSGVAAIRYTLDGSAPTVASLVYAGPLSLSQTTNLGFAAWDAAGNVEAPQFQTVQINAADTTVVSLTFDDGDDDQFQALNVLAVHGMHATFFLSSGNIGKKGYLSKDQALLLAQSGNEIGGQTIDNVDLTTIDDAEKMNQVCDDRVALLNFGLTIRSFAYPYGKVDRVSEQTVGKCGYGSARGVGGIVSPGSCPGCPFTETIPPSDPYDTKTPAAVQSSMSLNDIKNYVLQAEQNGGGWVQIVFHHICDNCQTDAVSPAALTAFLDWLELRSASGTVVKTVGDVIGGPVNPAVKAPHKSSPGCGMLLFNPSIEHDVITRLELDNAQPAMEHILFLQLSR